MARMELSVESWSSPLGRLTWCSTPDGALCGLAFEHRLNSLWSFLEKRFESVERRECRQPEVRDSMQRYFDGEIEAIDTLRVDTGGSEFQRSVWEQLRLVRGGMTASYSDLAQTLGKPTGFRAVATANATNPVAIVVPCHRIIHADGGISGYGGGVDKKRWLLEHEAEHAPFRLAP